MAFQGLDFRDLYRPGSGLTLRRLAVLVRALPASAPLWESLAKAEKKSQVAKPDEIRSRQADWEARNAARRAREEAAS